MADRRHPNDGSGAVLEGIMVAFSNCNVSFDSRYLHMIESMATPNVLFVNDYRSIWRQSAISALRKISASLRTACERDLC